MYYTYIDNPFKLLVYIIVPYIQKSNDTSAQEHMYHCSRVTYMSIYPSAVNTLFICINMPSDLNSCILLSAVHVLLGGYVQGAVLHKSCAMSTNCWNNKQWSSIDSLAFIRLSCYTSCVYSAS